MREARSNPSASPFSVAAQTNIRSSATRSSLGQRINFPPQSGTPWLVLDHSEQDFVEENKVLCVSDSNAVGRGQVSRAAEESGVLSQQYSPNNQPQSHVKCSNPLEAVAVISLLFHEAQLAANTTLVSIVRTDGAPKKAVCRMGWSCLGASPSHKKAHRPKTDRAVPYASDANSGSVKDLFVILASFTRDCWIFHFSLTHNSLPFCVLW